ncbi:MAG TPA: ABC transporter substrate-binding protein, partial [Gaiellaceae bacterium]|nr:ABC transporter substrate-binding protein [Gaiellaceae bacterium]
AALAKNGIDPNNTKDVTIFTQPFDMVAFLGHKIDAAAAMTYNELAQVLETKNPKTGKLYQLSDLNVFKMASPSVGTGMLEDNLFVRDDWLKSTTNQATLVKFLSASLGGWIYCRDHAASCVSTVLKNGPTLGKGHQTWQMNQINALMWPNTSGIGLVPASAVTQTATIAKKYGVIKNTPSGATNYTFARKAVALLKAQGQDVYGKSWKPANVTLTAGGA